MVLNTVLLFTPSTEKDRAGKRKLQKQLSGVLCKKDVLKNFSKFAGEYLSLLFDKVAGLRPAILLKKTLQHRCFL